MSVGRLAFRDKNDDLRELPRGSVVDGDGVAMVLSPLSAMALALVAKARGETPKACLEKLVQEEAERHALPVLLDAREKGGGGAQ